MESNDSAGQNADGRLLVVGVDGSACATSAVEFATRQAASEDPPLLVVSACHEMPAAGEFVVEGDLIHESADAVVADVSRAEELDSSVAVKGETREDIPRWQGSYWDRFPNMSCITPHATRSWCGHGEHLRPQAI